MSAPAPIAVNATPPAQQSFGVMPVAGGAWAPGTYAPGVLVSYAGKVYFSQRQTSGKPGFTPDWLFVISALPRDLSPAVFGIDHTLAWVPDSYPAGTVCAYSGAVYLATTQTSGVPGVSPDWMFLTCAISPEISQALFGAGRAISDSQAEARAAEASLQQSVSSAQTDAINALNELQSVAQQIVAINSQAASTAAAVTIEAGARSDADHALAGRIDSSIAVYGGGAGDIADALAAIENGKAAQTQARSLAAIVATQVSLADAQKALADYKVVVATQFGQNTALVSSESLARSDADTALGARIDSLTTTVNGNTAAISSESLARSNADTALGARIDTVTTSVNGNTASISTLQTSVNGLGVQWALQGTIDGVTGALVFSGVKAANGTGVTYTLRLDGNMEINGNLIVSGTIGSGQIANNAITETGFSSGGAANSGTVSVAVPANTTTIIRASYAGGDTIASGSSPTLKIYVNGSVVASSTVPVGLYTIGSPSTYMLGCTYLSYRYSTTADTTIDVYCDVEPNPGFFGQCTIEVLNMKR